MPKEDMGLRGYGQMTELYYVYTVQIIYFSNHEVNLNAVFRHSASRLQTSAPGQLLTPEVLSGPPKGSG
jgi:hypothetical protein